MAEAVRAASRETADLRPSPSPDRGAAPPPVASVEPRGLEHRSPPAESWSADEDALLQRQVTLLDLVDRALDKGVVVSGDVILSVAGVDLVRLDLRLMLGAVDVIAGSSAVAEEP